MVVIQIIVGLKSSTPLLMTPTTTLLLLTTPVHIKTVNNPMTLLFPMTAIPLTQDSSNDSFNDNDDDDTPTVGVFPLASNPAIPPTNSPFKFNADESAVASPVVNPPCHCSQSSRSDQHSADNLGGLWRSHPSAENCLFVDRDDGPLPDNKRWPIAAVTKVEKQMAA